MSPRHHVHGVSAGWDFTQNSATERPFIEWVYLWVHVKCRDHFVNWTVVPDSKNTTLDPLSKKVKCNKSESYVWVGLCSLNLTQRQSGSSSHSGSGSGEVQTFILVKLFLSQPDPVDALPSVLFHFSTQPSPNSHNSHTSREMWVCGEVMSLVIYLH